MAPIFLCGLDFSYLSGKSHAKDSPFHDWSRLKRESPEPATAGMHLLHHGRAFVRRGKDKTRNLMTNPVLAGYGKQLKDMTGLMDHSSVFDLADKGLDLGIPRANHKEALRLAQNYRPNKHNISQIPGQTDKNNLICNFLKEEAKPAGETYHPIGDSINNNEGEPESLLPPLKRV